MSITRTSGRISNLTSGRASGRARAMSSAVAAIGCAWAVAAAAGQPVTLTTNTTIGLGQTTIGSPPVSLETAEIVVRGATLSIATPELVTIQSLRLESVAGTGAVLTHPAGGRINLRVLANVEVDANSRIDASGLGNLGAAGFGAGESAPGFNGGGGGYGGAGGDAAISSQAVTSSTGRGGRCYGADQSGITAPTALGSGGGNASGTGGAGGRGGGAILLDVEGSFELFGSILADGSPGSFFGGAVQRSSGGGSGGSVFLIVDGPITGDGFVAARGGGSTTDGGGGGGGRISITYGAGDLNDLGLNASGGPGFSRGGAGTVYTRLSTATRGRLVVSNGGSSVGETTEFYGPTTLDMDVVVRGGGAIGPAHGQTDFNLSVLGSMNIEGGGFVTATGRGRPGSAGPGAGQSGEGLNGGGAGYGGAGSDAVGSSQARAGESGLGGRCYGFDQANVFAPALLGSGGGNVWSGGSPLAGSGGFGGGVIRLSVDGVLANGGQISADGTAGRFIGGASQRTSGGGSGGSVWITSGSMTGNGVVTARGGDSGPDGGGGGGGRVGILVGVGPDPATRADVRGGSGASRGGAGTIYTRIAAVPRGTIVIDNASAGFGETTEIEGPLVWDANLMVRRTARLGPAHGRTDFDLTVLGNTTVDVNAAIFADGRGEPGSTGPGAGGSGNGLNGGGGGFAGRGGASRNPGTTGGEAYGDSLLIGGEVLGSGGGNVWSGGSIIEGSGGAGGGTLRFETRGTLTLLGEISARGAQGQFVGGGSQRSSGGGSGGSVVLVANSISGTGLVAANGGSSTTDGGGGGGGRVVVATCSGLAPTVSVAGGSGFQAGLAGTSVVRAPGIIVQPADVTACEGDAVSLSVVVLGRGPITYRWQRGGFDISPVANPSAATATLTLSSAGAQDVASYRCVVTTGCGVFTSDAASVVVCGSCVCAADYDGDGGVTPGDVSAFFVDFEAGSACADVDRDGGVTPGDVSAFFQAFEAGGC